MNNQTPSAPLTNAPTDLGPPPDPRPETYSVEFMVETPEGFHCLFRGEGLAGKDMLPWMLATSKGLKAKGFLPVRRDVAVDVKVDAPVVAPAAEAPGPRGRGGGGRAAGNNRPARSTVSAPEACDMCGGPVYDNRARKASGQYKRTAPDYSCQDKDNCGAIAWQPKDGEPDWKYPAA